MAKETDKQGKTSHGYKWPKGKSGNPAGRPKNPIIDEMRVALATVEKAQRKTLLQHFFEKAFTDDRVLVAAAKKVAPDLCHTTGNIGLNIEVLPPIVKEKENK